MGAFGNLELSKCNGNWPHVVNEHVLPPKEVVLAISTAQVTDDLTTYIDLIT